MNKKKKIKTIRKFNMKKIILLAFLFGGSLYASTVMEINTVNNYKIKVLKTAFLGDREVQTYTKDSKESFLSLYWPSIHCVKLKCLLVRKNKTFSFEINKKDEYKIKALQIFLKY